MKRIILILLLFASIFSYAQTTSETSNILAGQYLTSTGNITTQNLVPAGTATAGSAVSLTLANQSTATIHVSGTYTGALSLQYSTDLGTTWVTFTNANQLTLETTGVPSATITSAAVGAWTTDISGLTNIRVTGLAAMTGTAVVSIRAVWGAQQVGINQALPTGANIIGALTANQSVNVGQINAVTPLMGNGVTGTGSQRVTIASDNTAFSVNLGTAGNGANSVGKAEDAAAASGDTAPAVLLLRNDALTSNVSASNDYIVPVTDIYGAQIIKDQQRHKRTYRTSFVVTPAATPTDVFQIIGSATTTVEITRIIISGTMTTGGAVDFYVSKRSTANTGGTSTSSTMVPLLSTDAAATAVCSIYTANPTAGTPVGDIWIESVSFPAVTGTPDRAEIKFGEGGRFAILSGVAQTIVGRLNGATVTGLSLKVTIEYTEY